jgi:TonB family protein
MLMLHSLVASKAQPITGAGSRTFSAVTHGALIALAIASTRSGPGSGVRGRLHEAAIDRVTYDSPSRVSLGIAEPVRRTRHVVAHTTPHSKLPRLQLDSASVHSSIDLPGVDLDSVIAKVPQSWLAMPDGFSDTTGVSGRMTSLLGQPAADAPPTGGPYTPEMVERIVAPAPGNPIPRYPDALRRRGVEASFVVRFVVDTTGRVDASQMEFPSTAHRQFVEAVKDALLQSHYFPALLGGRRVAQLCEQEFRFKIVP